MNLRPHLLREAEYRRQVYQVVLEPGTTLDHALQPEFWAHVSRKLKVRDRIEVHAQDGSWMAELLVRRAGPVSASVGLISKVTFDAAAPLAGAEGVEIKWRGPSVKWSAIRTADKAVLVENLDTREEVEAWLKKPQGGALAA